MNHFPSMDSEDNYQDLQNSLNLSDFKEEYINLEEPLNSIKPIFKIDNYINNNNEERPTAGISNYGNDDNKKLKENKTFLKKKRIKKKLILPFIDENKEKEKNIIIEIPETKQKKKPGRKTKKNPNIEHTKFADDNIRRKCKHLILKYLLEFINSVIFEMYKGNIGLGILKKELQTINQSQKSNATVNFNKDFLQKNIGEIFSENISGRYTALPLDHNKNIINILKNEEDENKKIHFIKLFNLSFKQCLNHFIGKENVDELKGLKCFSEIKDEIINNYPKDGKNYCENLEFYLNNYEEMLGQKKARRSRKKKEKIISLNEIN